MTRPHKQEQDEASPEVTEVAPGVLRIQLPIAFTGLGHVNCYALEDDRGVALVDPGMPGKDTFKVLGSRLAQAAIPLARVHTVVITHSHPDHFGGAGLLARQTGAEIVTSTRFRTWWDATESDIEQDPAADPHDDGMAIATPERKPGTPFGRPTPWGGTTFVPPLRYRVQFKVRNVIGSRWFAAPTATKRLDDADRLQLAGREWTAMHTPGHTEDHLCLFDPENGVLLSGDHVLPTITPHLSGMSPGDPLSEYYRSLRQMERLDGVTTALPAHGHPFDDLAGRARSIREHHEERLVRLAELVGEAGEVSVDDMSHALFGPHGADPLAQSETYAHLEHLRISGQATRRRTGQELAYSMVD